jgi:hypothetical protein
MAKTWVLDTETKGTGAQMVPLEKTLSDSAAKGPVVVSPRPHREPVEAEPRQPPRFKVVDAMTRQVLADGESTRATVELLEGLRSVVDVSVFVWDEQAQRWRLLTFGERKALWDLRGRSGRGGQ